MGDRCYMSVTCRRQDRQVFEELGFVVEYGTEADSTIITMIDEEANFAHYDKMPINIPFTAWNGAGSNYGEAKLVCDGKSMVEASTNHDGCFTVDWNYRFGLPRLKSIWKIRQFIKIERRVHKLFKSLTRPTQQVVKRS